MKVDNVVIKAVKKEDGVRIIEYFKSLGVDTKDYDGICYEEDGDVYIYYGVIDGKFNNYSRREIANARLETLDGGVFWTREQFVKLHNIACDSWKCILMKMFPEFSVKDACEIQENEYTSMRAACSVDQRKVLDEIFGKEPFKKKVYFMCTKDLGHGFTKDKKYELISRTRQSYTFLNDVVLEATVLVGDWADYFYKID